MMSTIVTGSSSHKHSLLIKWAIRFLMGTGLAAVMTTTMLASSPDLRDSLTQSLIRWADTSVTGSTTVQGKMSANSLVMAPFELDATAPDELNLSPSSTSSKVAVKNSANIPVLELEQLSTRQVKLANWIAKRYHVAPEMVALLVQESWNIGESTRIDPTLLLAIIAIESRFNPYAQSPVGAAGLMQVMTNVHSEKFERVGADILMAYDPVTNLRVGVLVLQEHVKRAGSLEGGLKQYVGAVGANDYGYPAKVLAERDRIRKVLFGSADSPSLEKILLVAKKDEPKANNAENIQQALAEQTTKNAKEESVQ